MLSSLIQIFPYQARLSVCLASILIFGLTTSASATTTHSVTSEEEVPVRSGQGTEYKILALLKDKELVTSLEDDGFWVRIRTATGREGWVLKRYLTSHPTPDEIFTLPSASLAAEPLPSSLPQPQQQSEGVRYKEDSAPTAALPLATAQGESVKQEALATTILPPQELTEKELSVKELQDELARLMSENKELRQNEKIQWFLAGGGVFVFGWLIGLITCRTKRRKPSLL